MLMKFCQNCGATVVNKNRSLNGSCDNRVTPQQPSGNLLLSGAIVATGNSYSSLKDFADSINLAIISGSVHGKNQIEIVFPVIQEQNGQLKKKGLL